MNPAGVFGQVAADRARRLTGRIRDVVKVVWCGSFRQLQINQSCLHDCQPIFRIEAQNFAHARELDDDSAVDCQRAAG